MKVIVVTVIAVLLWYFFRNVSWLYPMLIRPGISKAINYTIYYFRRWFLFESVKKAKREHYAGYAKEQRRKHKINSLTNIAVVNINRNKYTETFIDLKIKGLKNQYYVHQFYGGNFPTSEVHANHLLSKKSVALQLIEWWKFFLNKGVHYREDALENYLKLIEWKEHFLNKGRNYYLKKAFIEYLEQNNIKIVFAEFGTSGVEVFEDCKKAGIPLIVTFRGYDIHHKEIFETNCERYKGLLAYCSSVICVSKDILHRIESLYGIKDKLFYLPSPIDLNLFSYKDHSNNPPVFLFVGRFSETKSPHLVILSFFEVLKQMPGARLVMIGQGGGGELFESSLILARALGIEDKIDFKGIQTPAQVSEEMNNARVFVQHSLTTPVHGDKEGTPVSVREAMACGLPVVATNHAGIAETIVNEETGVLINEYEYLSMAKEMIRVCNSDELVYELGKKAALSIRNNELIIQNAKILVSLVENYRLK